jgi:flagellar motor switch protein FliN/FliY
MEQESASRKDGEQDRIDLSLLLDVPLRVTVELGRARMTVDRVLRLNPGSVVELDRLAGEPLDILVNEKLIARGEAVVLKEKLAVRIVDIVSPQKRVESLR